MLKILNFNIFGVFIKMNIFGSVKKLWIFRVITKNGLFGVISIHFGVFFLKARSFYRVPA